MRILWLFPLVVLMCHHSASTPAETPRVICGRMLAHARMLHCYGSYEMGDNPSDQLDSAIEAYDKGVQYGDHVTKWPWNSRPKAALPKSLERDESKSDSGLVDECCLKPCYISDILSYC